MVNRLQFVHNDTIFPSREDAINYVIDRQSIERPSLYAEPIVLRYENPENDKEPNVILAIGSVGNGTTPTTDNKTFFIDIAGINEEIEDLDEKIEEVVKLLSMVAIDSDTLDLTIDKQETGITLSGDVKVPETVIVNRHEVDNIIKTNENGLYSYVNLTFDDATNSFKFQVNDNINEFALPVIESGEYNLEEKKLIFTYTDGNTISVNVNDLARSWETQTNTIHMTYDEYLAANNLYETSIILKKDEHSDRKDVLWGDVKIASSAYTRNNILKKNENGGLYVEGNAKNIKYLQNGEMITVQDAIESITTLVSENENNIIYKKYDSLGNEDGIFASVSIAYDNASNILYFTNSTVDGGTVTKQMKLNSTAFIDNITYDSATETLRINYIDKDGNVEYVDLPLSEILDSWIVENEGHNVHLTKNTQTPGKDILTADVKIATKTNINNNILEDEDHKLVVKGFAWNVKYDSNETVEQALNRIKNEKINTDAKIETLSGAIDTEESRATTAENNIQSELDATQAGAGLDTDGAYIQNDNAHYIDKAHSLADADNKLDEQVFVNTEAIEGLTESVENEIQRATTTENNIQSELDNTQTGAGLDTDGSYIRNDNANYIDKANSLADADNKLDEQVKVNADAINDLDAAIAAEIARATTTESNIQSELDTTQAGAGLNDDGTYNQNVNANYIFNARSLAEADNKLDTQVKTNADAIQTLSAEINTNKISVEDTATVNMNLREVSQSANVISSDVIVSNDPNNILLATSDGLAATIIYDEYHNTITLSNGTVIQLTHSIYRIYYDSTREVLVIEYIVRTGIEVVEIPVHDMIDEWDVNVHNISGDSRSSGITLSLERSVPDKDILSAAVNISTVEDNILQLAADGGLYVPSSASEEKVNNIIQGTGLDEEGHYRADPDTKYIYYIGSLMEADVKLDTAIYEISGKTGTISGDLITLSAISNSISGEVDTVEASAGLDADGRYVPDSNSHYIQAARSLSGADSLLDAQVYKNATDIATLSGEISDDKTELYELSGKVSTVITSAGLNENGTYPQHQGTRYLNGSVSLNNADEILDTKLYEVSGKTDTISGDLITLSATSNSISGEVDTIEASAGLDADGRYVPDSNSHYIQAARSLSGADSLLDAQVYKNATDIATLSGEIVTNKIDVEDTKSISMTLEETQGGTNIIKSDIKISEKSANIIVLDETSSQDGIYASAEIGYNENTHVITLTTSNGTSSVNLENLSNDWTVSNENNNVTLVKTVNENEDDVLTANVNVAPTTTAPYSDNILINAELGTGRALYVPGSGITENKNNIAQLSGTVSSIGERLTTAEETIATHTTQIATNANDIAAEVERATNAETTLLNKINAETERAQNIEDDLNDAIEAEIQRATSAEEEIKDMVREEKERAISSETTINNAVLAERERATVAETTLQNLVNTEKSRAELAEQALSGAVDTETTRATNAESTLNTALSNEVTRAQGVETTLNDAITAETAARTSSDSNLQTAIENEASTRATADSALSDRIATNATNLASEIQRASGAENTIIESIATERTRAQGVENVLSGAITSETAARVADVERLEAEITSSTITVGETDTILLSKSSDNEITGVVKLDNNSEGNILLSHTDGLYANVGLTYDTATNTLHYTVNGVTNDIALNAGSIIDDISYNPTEKTLVITYTTATGEQRSATVGISDLIDIVTVQSGNHMGGIQLTSYTGDNGETVISAGTVISSDENNILVNDNGVLKVIGTASNIKYGSGTVETALDELMDGGDIQEQIDALSGAIDTVSGEVVTLSSHTNDIEAELNTVESSAGFTESGQYEPNPLANYISGATSLKNADELLDTAVKNIEDKLDELSEGSATYSTIVSANEDGNIQADVKLSHGYSQQSEEIENVEVNNYSEIELDNLLRIIHVKDSIKEAKSNGLYFDGSIDYGEF